MTVKDERNHMFDRLLRQQVKSSYRLTDLCRQLASNPMARARYEHINNQLKSSQAELQNMANMLDALEPGVTIETDSVMIEVFADLRDSHDRLHETISELQAQHEAGRQQLH